MDKLYIQDGDLKREYTEQEYAQHELDKAELAETLKEQEIKEKAKAALLTKLGITAEEAALLLG
jgi:hypothetical protein